MTARMRAYLTESQRPWPSLLLVLPLVAIYETASRGLLGPIEFGSADQLVAFSMLRQAFIKLGAHGPMLPSLALVACLLGWHIAKRDHWTIKPRYLGAMALEGGLLALPLVAAAMLIARFVPFAASDTLASDRLAVLAVGAAVYEELLFRLVGFVLLSVLLADVCRLKRIAADGLTIIGTAGLFAAYHYLGSEAFSWPTFAFRFAAGLFLGGIFAVRGFGVTVFCHAVYDIIWVIVVARMSVV